MHNKYILLRHGQTIYQTEKKSFYYPSPEIPPVSLTEKGEKQVRESVDKLKNKRIDLIFSSDFFRAKQTAEIAVKGLSVKKINFDKRLRDTNVGEIHGKLQKDYRDFFLNKPKRFNKRPPGGESWNDVKKRTKSFLDDIERKYKKKNILIVSHGDPLWLLAGLIKGVETNEDFLNGRDETIYPKTGQLLTP